MSAVKLSKSTYCNAVQCEKMLWLAKYKPEVGEKADNSSILETGEEVGQLAKNLFGAYYDIDKNQGLAHMVMETANQIEMGTPVITEGSFAFNNNFCSVDILKNDSGVLEIFEVKSATEIKDIYYEDLAYQYYVLTKLGYKISGANIVYINNKYTRYGELELDKLFIIEDLTKIIINMQDEVATKIKFINEYMTQKSEPTKDIGPYCSDPYDCEYWRHCTKELPPKNVFDIAGLTKKTKFKLYYSGLSAFEDLKDIDLNPKYLEQVIYELENKPPKIELEKIGEFLADLYYPLYFLDFETFQQAIPLYDGINAYMQIPFQYSLHYIEKKDGPLMHREFLAYPGADPREDLARKLIADIPLDACVLAYNMGFEKGVIRNLANNYPDLAKPLLQIHDNIQDLMLPFQKRHFYAKEMQGSYSIKKVLPTLFPGDAELDYKKLALIHNGSEAMSAFADLKNKSDEEIEKVRAGLLEYCKLDTLAMVKIWQKLKAMIK